MNVQGLARTRPATAARGWGSRPISAVVFTDLDGTLLDEVTFSCSAALPTLRALEAASIPVVPVTSKTAAEVRHLRSSLGLSDPYVVESGAAAFLPLEDGGERRVVWSPGRPHLSSFLDRHRAEFDLRCFSDMSIAEVAARTGLSLEAARRAKQREYTEPFLLGAEERLEELEEKAREEDLRIEAGGLFLHLSASHDKGTAVRWLLEEIDGQGSAVRSIGLGDSPNDLSFLRSVAEPITIPRLDGRHLPWRSDRAVRRAPLPGSRGWSAVVREVLGPEIDRESDRAAASCSATFEEGSSDV
ncbi:MAG: HAD-IIB family hydrolase [Thermoanaerobaculia bacterium]|nr:HAD-IIB family hydrolase [Thermoanaerobaculia bacterium]